MRILFKILYVVLLAWATSPLSAQFGILDESFGQGGIVIPSISELDDVGHDVLEQSDGKIIIGGSSGQDYALLRLHSDGTPDTSFGNAGIVITNYKGSDDEGLAIALQEDGKILLCGRSSMDFSLLRYHTDGSLDLSFGNNGVVTTDIAGDYDVARAIDIQADGKIVLAGSSDSSSIITLIRYNEDGSLDSSFGEEGISTVPFESGFDIAHAIQILESGKILIAGSTYVDIVLLRYNANGYPDTSFGENGRVMTNLGANYEAGKSIAVQEDGKILIGGYTSAFLYDTYFALVRYNADGNLDSSFNGTGIVTADIGPDLCRGNSIVIQADGKIILAGYMSEIGITLIRYNSDGSTDSSFSQDGIVTTSLGEDSEANRVVLQADGKILITGYVLINDNLEIVAARYISGLVVGIEEEKISQSSFNIFPNPTIGKCTLEIILKAKNNFSIDLLSIHGEKIRTIAKSISCDEGINQIQIDQIDGISQGIYFIRISDDNGEVKSLPVIIQ